jgi:hypothetical protein
MSNYANEVRPLPSIAIIGTEGSGKTVLTVTLAKRLSTIDARGVFLNPQGVGTLKYVEKVWQTLQQGDWPPSTPPGSLFQLRWKLEIVGDVESEVRLVDAAGQDLRLLFGDDRVADLGSLPDTLRQLTEYCRCANIVLFLINLRDFIGQGNPQQRTENEAAIKGAMDYLNANGGGKRFCLIFTQVDLYRQLAASRGSWRALAEEAIPYVYAAYIKSKQMPVFLVSAVNKTRVTVDDSGVPLRMPEPGFGSDGFDKVVDWMTTQVREVQTELTARPTNRAISNNPPAELLKLPEWLTFSKYAWFGVVVFVLFLTKSCFFGSSAKSPVPGTSKTVPDTPKGPQPVILGQRYEDESGFFGDSVISYGTVKNNGDPGNVVVISRLWENGVEVDAVSWAFFLNAGESRQFQYKWTKIQSVKNPHTVRCEAKVPGVE